jgi:hypothetical protein
MSGEPFGSGRVEPSQNFNPGNAQRLPELGGHMKTIAFKIEGSSVAMPWRILCGVAVLWLALSLCAASLLAQTPQINSVQFTGSAGNYSLTLKGSGFGHPTVPLPYRGDVGNFHLGDAAQVGRGEWGYTGDANVLTYASWSDSTIAISRFGGQPCDAVNIAVWNSVSQHAGTWGGNVPCSVSTPQITSVELSGTGANLQMIVHGSGFGPFPSSMPSPGTAADLNYFKVVDFRSHCGARSSLFEAGFGDWGGSPDSVTLYYTYWADNQIIFTGFGGSYGTGCASYKVGDPLAVFVYNSEDTTFSQAQTAWGGPAAASITISVEDITTGESVANGTTIPVGDTFQVTVTGAPEYDCSGQFVVTAVGAPANPPSVSEQLVGFVIGPAVGTNTVSGQDILADGTVGSGNDWRISASCNGTSPNSFAFANFEFLTSEQ